MAGPRGESSPRGTEAICLCSGPVGRSHTVGTGKRKGGRRSSTERDGEADRKGKKQRIKWCHINVIANHLQWFVLFHQIRVYYKVWYFAISCLVIYLYNSISSILLIDNTKRDYVMPLCSQSNIWIKRYIHPRKHIHMLHISFVRRVLDWNAITKCGWEKKHTSLWTNAPVDINHKLIPAPE